MKKIFLPKTFTVYKQGYSKKQFFDDLLAGVIVGVIALPLAIAFSIASGVSPEKGLITAVVAGFLISFLGGSRVTIGGPTGAFVVIIVGIVNQYGMEGLIISTVLAGIFMILFGLLQLGTLIKFIPQPLIVGFTSGIAVIIFTSQMNDFFGLSLKNLPSSFIDKWILFFSNYNKTNYWAIGIALFTVIISLFFKRITKQVPGSIIAILITTIAVSVFSIPVDTISSITDSIPNRLNLSFSTIELRSFSNYVQPAFTIALLGAIESLLCAVVADGMTGSNHRSNTELIGQGIANVFSGLLGGIPATGAIARTAANVKLGGRTPVAGMVHALTLLLILLFFGKYAVLIPLSCLAGILVVIAYNMSEWRSFINILKGSRYDIIVLLVTFFLTILFDLSLAIQVGVILAAFLFMQRMSKLSEIYSLEREEDSFENYSEIPKAISIYEINGPFFFGAANKYKEVIKELGVKANILILRMRHVPFIDNTGIHNFYSVLSELKSKNIKIILSGVNPEVKNELMRSKIAPLLGEENICDHFDKAKALALEIYEAQKNRHQ